MENDTEVWWDDELNVWLYEKKKLLLDDNVIIRYIIAEGVDAAGEPEPYMDVREGTHLYYYRGVEIANIVENRDLGIWVIFLANQLGDEPEAVSVEISNSKYKTILSYFKLLEARRQVEKWIPKIIKGGLRQDAEFRQYLKHYLNTEDATKK